MPAISVVVPIYNVENYLEQCIDSISNQTLKDIEILLVDDGSRDSSGEICDHYALSDSRIKTIHKAANAGLVAARKTGLENAAGDYIAYVDGDDWIEPQMLEKLWSLMISQEVDIVFGGHYENIGANSKPVFPSCDEGRYNKEQMIEKVYPRLIASSNFYEWGVFPSLWGKLFRREQLEKFQMKVDERITIGEDAACVYPCMLCAESIYILKECIYHYRQTTSSMIKKIGDYELEKERFRILNEYTKRELYNYRDVYNVMEQWNQYLLFIMLPRAGSLYSGYDKLDYLFPFTNIKKGERIILYGAGTFGQCQYQYLKRTGFCNVVAWTDRNYKALQSIGLDVCTPDIIGNYSFDHIAIAITFAEAREEAYRDLISRFGKEKVETLNEDLLLSEETKQAFGLSSPITFAC